MPSVITSTPEPVAADHGTDDASVAGADPRRLCGAALVEALRDSRRRTLSWTDDLLEEQWAVPRRPGINPPAWELAHLAWFAEFWVLRGPHRVTDAGSTRAARPPLHAGPDEWLDSSLIAHERRWAVPLPRDRVRAMLDAQLAACIEAVPHAGDDRALYFHRLALFHEDMHAEAFAWMRAALGYPAPRGVALPRAGRPALTTVEGGDVVLGGARMPPAFAFDNELPGSPTAVPSFEIDTAPVTTGMYLDFVEAGGYEHPDYWPGEAGRWRADEGRRHPERWRRAGGGTLPAGSRWEARWFDRWQPLDPAQPMIHVNAFEAEAYCRWAGRRLPTAAQWEHAARSTESGPRDGTGAFTWGRSVWEWTASPFLPYPGFLAGPYKEYSTPWFGRHRELRGGAFTTHARLHDPRYRNFFMPHRSDIFAGFRTIAGSRRDPAPA